MPMTPDEVSLAMMQSLRKVEEDEGMRPGELLEAMVEAFNARFGEVTPAKTPLMAKLQRTKGQA